MYLKFLKTILSFFILSFVFTISMNCSAGGSENEDSSDPQASLILDKETVSFDSNTTATITATAKKSDGTDDTITAVSSDTTAATVAVDGLVVTVTGIKAGTPTITITSGSGLDEACVATVNASWHTVFEDNFNRVDSATLGSDWEVINPGMKIEGNRLYSAMTSYASQDPGMIMTTKSYNQNIIRTTVKMTTSDKIVDPTGASDTNKSILLARYNYDSITPANSTGYCATVRTKGDLTVKVLYIERNDSLDLPPIDEEVFEQTVNTTYLYDFTLNGSDLTFILKDSSGTALKTLTASDSNYTTGRVGLYGGSWDKTEDVAIPVYFDDLKIEEYK